MRRPLISLAAAVLETAEIPPEVLMSNFSETGFSVVLNAVTAITSESFGLRTMFLRSKVLNPESSTLSS